MWYYDSSLKASFTPYTVFNTVFKNVLAYLLQSIGRKQMNISVVHYIRNKSDSNTSFTLISETHQSVKT